MFKNSMNGTRQSCGAAKLRQHHGKFFSILRHTKNSQSHDGFRLNKSLSGSLVVTHYRIERDKGTVQKLGSHELRQWE